jgi:tetratricopeptide (TPR) repeat protein
MNASARPWLLRACVIAAVLVGALISLPAEAQPEIDEENGRALATEAMAFYKEGSYEQALAKFREAREVYPSGQVLRMTGYTLMALGRWLEAADVLEAAIAAKLKPLESDDAEHAKMQLKEVLEHIAIVTVTSKVSGARVAIDDESPRKLPATVRLDPGGHNFVVSAPGHEDASASPELGAGERTTITLDPKKRVAKRPRPASEPAPRTEESGTTFGWFPGQGIVGLVMAGVGVAAGGVALGVGIHGLSLRDSVQEQTDAHYALYGEQCTQQADLCRANIGILNAEGERAADYQNAAMVTGIVGVVLFAGGLTLFLMSDMSPLAPAPEDEQASFVCAPGWMGAGCAGTF